MNLKRPSILALLLVIAGAVTAHAGVKITIVNANAPTIGFNDTTPVTPVGGNSGTTLGQQRLIAFQKAADIWGALLDSSVEIRVRSTFEPLDCDEDEATLGSAGARFVFSDFPNAPRADIFYHAALASKLANRDLTLEINPNGEEMIIARFNSNLGKSAPPCLPSQQWYYGIDGNQPVNSVDLVSVLLHEFAHGLGFATLVNKETGALFRNKHDAYSIFILDNKTGLKWTQMDDAQRAASTISDDVVWDGANVTREAALFLHFAPLPLRINSPAAIAGDYVTGTASFAAGFPPSGLTGNLVLGLDAANDTGPSTTDGCTAFTNASTLSGNIAVVDRGTCTFISKANNAQLAGARALLILDSPTPASNILCIGCMPGSGFSITIPVLAVSNADGVKIKAQLAGGVNATIRSDSTKQAGADGAGRLRLYAPAEVLAGSSISHWDVSATPNLLMEPRINSDIDGVDLTLAHFADIGWLTLTTSPPNISATKSAGLQTDRDGDGLADPGDTIRYTVVVRNSGGVASGAHFRDTIDASTTLAGGSITTTQGTIDSTAPIDASLGDLAPNGQATIRFDVTLNNNTSSTVTSISNQGRVDGTNFTEITTDDPDTTTAGDSTRTTTNFNAITAQLTASIAIDADGNNLLTRGDTLLYTATVRNLGSAPASGIVYTSSLPVADLTLLNGSATTTQGTATSGAGVVSVNVGTIAAGGSVTITYRVLVNPAIPAGRLSVSSQGTVTGAGMTPVVTDDPATTALGDPTVSFFPAGRRRGARR